MFKNLLSKGINGSTYTEAESRALMDDIMTGVATENQVASLLTLLRFRGETIDELTGFVKSMRKHAVPFSTPFDNVVDTCGTGGDGAGTFNISTAAAIVMASIGVKVAKHGNRAFSSKSGSADVLEHLNIPIQLDREEALQALEEHSMCFLYAPNYHAAMKHAVNPRKEIGFRTVFNILGPLCNPASCQRQLLGVADPILAGKIAAVAQRIGMQKVMVVTGDDGLDECSITTTSTLLEVTPQSIKKVKIDPTDVGLVKGNLMELSISSSSDSAALIQNIFKGKANRSAIEIVVLNAAVGLVVADKVQSLEAGVKLSKQAIDSGNVWDHYLKMSGSRGMNRVYA
ncbi:anthranilate phosphoribosyltransferase [Alkalihalobacillus sp. AL-G]|uniref:anthranilate phosphoribosyltransferase n=1 Tax=Alkalihalobacillus sp. AL-G TaxID=2926399 RepID=UPI002729F61C|nr:anthranilate phosphoribosyltransferase [Alkalihalobacillus sp. AL-G]WLD91823.1 anthranilate phosphoribosyltransferase [Alkalihalobacillus sp. AL-G]